MSHTIEIPWDEMARVRSLGDHGIECFDFDLLKMENADVEMAANF